MSTDRWWASANFCAGISITSTRKICKARVFGKQEGNEVLLRKTSYHEQQQDTSTSYKSVQNATKAGWIATEKLPENRSWLYRITFEISLYLPFHTPEKWLALSTQNGYRSVARKQLLFRVKISPAIFSRIQQLFVPCLFDREMLLLCSWKRTATSSYGDASGIVFPQGSGWQKDPVKRLSAGPSYQSPGLLPWREF